MDYPLEFTDLKRTITATKQMVGIDEVQWTSAAVQTSLDLLKDSVIASKNTFNSVAEVNKEEFNALVDQLVLVGNDLNSKITNLNAASTGSVEEVGANLSKLKDLIEKDGVMNVLNSIDRVADEANERYAVFPFVGIITDNTGQVNVDISVLGIAVDTDYTVQMTKDSTAGHVFTDVEVKKVDASTVSLKAWDVPSYTPEKAVALGKVKDGSVTPVKVVFQVCYFRPKISIQLTETDGDVNTVGLAQ